MDQSRTLTGIRGTKGYVALDWFRHMAITIKVNVYSYGVMLLEIICCRRSVEMVACEKERAILTDWAYACYREETLDALVEYDEQALDDRKNLEVCDGCLLVYSRRRAHSIRLWQKSRVFCPPIIY